MDDTDRYYRVLGLEPGASPDEVKQAYRDLVKVWHPDRFVHDGRLQQKAQERLKEINNAYQKLRSIKGEPGSRPGQRWSQAARPSHGPPDESKFATGGSRTTSPGSGPSTKSDIPQRRDGGGLGPALTVSVLVLALAYALAKGGSTKTALVSPPTPTVAPTLYAEQAISYVQQKRSVTRAQAIDLLAAARAKGDANVLRIVDLDEFLAREIARNQSLGESPVTPTRAPTLAAEKKGTDATRSVRTSKAPAVRIQETARRAASGEAIAKTEPTSKAEDIPRIVLPEHAHVDFYGHNWECDRGYGQSGERCVAVGVPKNAHIDFYGHDWDCDRGYRQVGNGCLAVEVPANAKTDFYGHNWECKRGYRQAGEGCVAVEVPKNARIDFYGHDWDCDRGYRQVGGGCVVVELPANAKIDFYGHDWECKRGYARVGSQCRPIK